MDALFPSIGPYFWWIVAGGLLLAELMQPGFFMIWLAAAAALTATLQVIFHLDWMMEVVSFAILSVLSVGLSWRIVTSAWSSTSDQPNLNQSHHAFIGKTFYLEKPIVDGHGKIKVDDRIWDVQGPDLPMGAQVKVTAVEGLRLRVKEA